MTISLQASLLCRPSPSLTCYSPLKQHRLHCSLNSPRRHHHLHHSFLHLSNLPFFASLNSRFHLLPLSLSCSLQPENINLNPDLTSSGCNSNSDSTESIVNEFSTGDTSFVYSLEGSRVDELGGGSSGKEDSENVAESEGRSENLLQKEEVTNKLPLLVFLMGLWAMAKRELDKLLASDWLSWVPFWHQEKRLERLIVEADANPKDAEKQSALLAELNKHSPESVIKRFERREHAVDTKGVAEYLRALVVTNAIADYLPDEQSGKPSSLPALLKDLIDEPFVNPGISEKQPLHVVMVRINKKSLTW